MNCKGFGRKPLVA